MADEFGNYFAAFLMAGGVAIVASLIPFLLICVKQKKTLLMTWKRQCTQAN